MIFSANEIIFYLWQLFPDRLERPPFQIHIRYTLLGECFDTYLIFRRESLQRKHILTVITEYFHARFVYEDMHSQLPILRQKSKQ